MATKGKQPTKKAEETKVTRITASDPVEVKDKPAKKPQVIEEKDAKGNNPFKSFIGYFAGAWFELKQVRWPTRRATWGMTMAVLAFTAFFVVIILLLDALFKYLFQLILG